MPQSQQPPQLAVIYRDPNDLVPYERNARTHSKEQIEQVAASIKEFGFTNPILLKDDDKTIGAGHRRREGALLLGMSSVPTITLHGLTDAQWRAYVIADNQIAVNAGWDVEKLSLEIGDLKLTGLNLSLTGFAPGELSDILAPPQDFELPPPPNSVAVTQDRLRNIREQRNRGKTNVVSKGDTEHYVAIVYPSREEKEAALAKLGLPADERYVLASAVNVTRRLTKGPSTPQADRSTKAAPQHKAGAVG